MTFAPDSSVAGYLGPSGAQLDDTALEDFLHDVVAGITGLDGTLVRPRWQEEPPNWPPFRTNWVSIGVASTTPDTFAYENHLPDGEGSDDMRRHEVFDLACSFYGPDADAMADTLRDGFQVAQNRTALFMAGMGLVSCGPSTAAPVLLKERWLNRTDMVVTIKREIRRTYPVLNILSVDGSVTNGPLAANVHAG